MANDPVSICSEALVMLGEKPIDDLDSATAQSLICKTLYQSKVDELLGSHPWTFNRIIAPLNRLADLPSDASGFAAAYQLPAGVLRIVRPFVGGTGLTDWGEAQALIFLDATANDLVELEYHGRAAEPLWRPAFRQAVVLSMAATLALPITDSETKLKLMAQLAERALAQARNINAQEKPAIRLAVGRLDRARAI